VRTVPIERRPNKVAAAEFASPPPGDRRERSFSAFLKSLPDVLVARDFLRVVNAIAAAAKARKAVVVMLGGHIVKTGLAPLLIELMKTHRSPGVRRKAAFWLGQKKDPRALDALADILR